VVRVRFETLIVVSLAVVASLLFSGVLPIFASVVIGTSMLPTLKPLDVVIAVKPWLKRVHVGDIAIVKIDDVRLVHRVIRIEDGLVVTKGDNNAFPDPPTKHVLGVVILVIPREAVVLTLIALAIIGLRPFASTWLAKALAPLVGVVLSAVIVSSIGSLMVLHPLSNLVSMPSLRVEMFRSNATTTIIDIVTNASPTDIKCWVNGFRATATLGTRNEHIAIVVRVPTRLAMDIVQHFNYVRVKCVVAMRFRGKPFEYRMFVAQNIPLTMEFRVRYEGGKLLIEPVRTPLNAPLAINVTISGCSKTVRLVNRVAVVGNPLTVPWNCDMLTLVKISSVVAGHPMLRVYLAKS